MTKKLPIEANEYHLIFKASSGRKESNATAGVCITHIEEILAYYVETVERFDLY